MWKLCTDHCCSATKLCVTPCNPVACSMPDFPVLYHLPEFEQNTSIESVMQSNHLNLCYPLLILPSGFPNIRVFSNESPLHFRWPNYWISTPASVLLMNIQYCFLLGLTGLISLQSKGLSRVFSNTTVQKQQFFSSQPSLWSNSHIHTRLLETP